MKKALACLMLFAVPGIATADVSRLERRQLEKLTEKQHGGRGAENGLAAKSNGDLPLTDASGLEYFLNTDITYITSSSASAAASEASYTAAVAATTMGGGTTSSTLEDAFDGYNAMCLVVDNTITLCSAFDANFVVYRDNGPPIGTECTGGVSGVDRQVIFPVQTSGTIQMQRKVFVPDNDEFARWLNYFTNTDTMSHTVTMVTSNNLGSDDLTRIVSSSSGDAAADTTDTWVSTFEDYSGTTSSDPRLGHVLQGPGAAVPLAGVTFTDGDENPFWGYTFTLAPGETKIIVNYATGQPSKADANAKAAELGDGLNANQFACMSDTERAQVANFVVPAAVFDPTIPTVGTWGLTLLGLLLAAAALVVLRHS